MIQSCMNRSHIPLFSPALQPEPTSPSVTSRQSRCSSRSGRQQAVLQVTESSRGFVKKMSSDSSSNAEGLFFNLLMWGGEVCWRLFFVFFPVSRLSEGVGDGATVDETDGCLTFLRP